ncbi:3-hydroxyacyl-CoA dehydrogenase/enoyl-CoA hydratase family protein [Geomonas azotofigens]|uniref:3-hydroxyacyl-CoA dehydrogenase/enoyl-CoA hydratase family protein n=1 Tax=Geomonas azotofigens TaxID=2843196 RepID=UPI001C10A3F5|nr:3-hydroxyacyl-CoA dehydrogenase/enoyl-CoA hydratase family protein [Geomonas azotofigens]MBU5613827.1 3-hydroxyacyl-CoA dehydrogenase/enoyl-CoA hydratase family protein [Geomonas azotofigens]
MRQIKKVAVLGAGVMGATIAGHLANAGLEVVLLDMVPREVNREESEQGLSLDDRSVRNRFAANGLQAAVKGRGVYRKDYAGQITIGNFDDDISLLKECDWVIEVVVENMAIKKSLLTEKVVPNLAPGAILSTNTSGLSVNAMAELLPPAVRANFLVTHFFNPPRYMRLLELVPCAATDPAVLAHMAEFCRRRLGKGIVFGKDTPNFIGNRIGVFAMFNAMRHMTELGMTVEEVDAVGGPATARASSAIFRTCDLVGNDTLVHVGRNSYELLPNDEQRETFRIPAFLEEMVAKGLLGNKTKQGFFKKEKDGISYYDWTSGAYKPAAGPKFASLAAAKGGDPAGRIRKLLAGDDVAARFAWLNLRDILLYTVRRMPEIADDIVNVDNALKWGFSWELGPFEMLDAIGVREFVARAEGDGVPVPDVLRRVESFYKYQGGTKFAWDLAKGAYTELPVPSTCISLDILKRGGKLVEGNADASLYDLGDGVFGLEFHSKMNAIDDGILEMISTSVQRAERQGVGLVIGNQGKVFSAGANLAKVAAAIKDGNFEAIERLIRSFHSALMGVKYSHVPVVAAPFNMTLGGGCEVALQADVINAHAETYMGLVEVGVGLLPAGGGTKEMALRAMALTEPYRGDVTQAIGKFFQNIVTAKVSGSAAELAGMGMLRQGDGVTMDIDSLIADAKLKVLALAPTYRPGRPLENLKAPGRSVASGLKNQVYNMQAGGFATEYEAEMGSVIADVITGGDVPGGTAISEQYLLDLEREAFLSLCGRPKTLARIEHMLSTGKPLRN